MDTFSVFFCYSAAKMQACTLLAIHHWVETLLRFEAVTRGGNFVLKVLFCWQLKFFLLYSDHDSVL